jgi:hypothetical protein
MRRRTSWTMALAALAVLPVLSAACGGDSPTTPTPTTYSLTVQVRNEQGGAVPGALARISDGANSGRNATSDATGNATMTGLSLGAFTLEVTASGYQDVKQSVTLSATLTTAVTLKVTANAPPVVTLAVKGTLAKEPSGYVDLSETATATATVTDAETAADKLTYEWSATSGTVTGTGPSVQWKPASAGAATLTLVVIEKYGPSNLLENRVTTTAKAAVHDGQKESGDVTTLFLKEFSDSTIPAATVVRNFSDSCAAGKADEVADISDNRARYKILSNVIGAASVSLNFSGTCSYASKPGDACVIQPCEWTSQVLATGASEHVRGTCYLTTVFDAPKDAWKLCWSNFQGVLLPSGRAIKWF